MIYTAKNYYSIIPYIETIQNVRKILPKVE